MNLFKCLCFGIVAILLCGCFESGGEFDALNAGKISVMYENQTLKIVESSADSAILQKEPPTNSSIVDESQRVASEAKQKSGLRSHE